MEMVMQLGAAGSGGGTRGAIWVGQLGLVSGWRYRFLGPGSNPVSKETPKLT